jgi:hypothetical protein
MIYIRASCTAKNVGYNYIILIEGTICKHFCELKCGSIYEFCFVSSVFRDMIKTVLILVHVSDEALYIC